MKAPVLIVDFEIKTDLSNWSIVDDVVMGGVSAGNFYINNVGNAIFKGEVSIENNGGFSSVRYDCNNIDVRQHSSIAIRLRGDTKKYQFRVKSSNQDMHSYIAYFETSGEWEIINLPLNEFQPTFRGRKLSMPRFNGEFISQIAILIGNKKSESYELEIDWIILK